MNGCLEYFAKHEYFRGESRPPYHTSLFSPLPTAFCHYFTQVLLPTNACGLIQLNCDIWWIPLILAYNTRGNPNWRFQTSRFTTSVVLLSTPSRLVRQSYELNASTLICIPNSVRAMFLKFSSNSSSNFRAFRIGNDEVPHMKKATTRC